MLYDRDPLIMLAPAHDEDNAYVPIRKSSLAVGFDVAACCIQDPFHRGDPIGYPPVTIDPGEQVLFGCGYKAAIPPGIDCQVRPRSGLAAKHGIILANGVGTIDPDFRGEIGVALLNMGEFPVTIDRGDRIAQLVFVPVIFPEFHVVESSDMLPATIRGTGGFGSTGLGADEGWGTAEHDDAVARRDRNFMKMAMVAGEESTCVRGCPTGSDGIPIRDSLGNLVGATRKIGCIIAMGGSVVSSGFNTHYPGAKPCAEIGCLREREQIPSGTQLERCRAIHAEDMAIDNALLTGVKLRGSTIYCTHEPCLNCARKMTALELEALVVVEGSYSGEGIQIVRESGTIVRLLSR